MFPKRLKELRGEKGLSQRELAKLLNISSSTIAMYEIGQRDPDTETLQRLSEFFWMQRGLPPWPHRHSQPCRRNSQCSQGRSGACGLLEFATAKGGPETAVQADKKAGAKGDTADNTDYQGD